MPWKIRNHGAGKWADTLKFKTQKKAFAYIRANIKPVKVK